MARQDGLYGRDFLRGNWIHIDYLYNFDHVPIYQQPLKECRTPTKYKVRPFSTAIAKGRSQLYGLMALFDITHCN